MESTENIQYNRTKMSGNWNFDKQSLNSYSIILFDFQESSTNK